MLLSEIASSRTAMALTAAAGYAIATFFMKLMADTPNALWIAAIAVVLAGTVAAEIVVLRQIDFGLAYVAIIATETLLVLAFTFIIGEVLSARELMGGALVVAGAALVSF